MASPRRRGARRAIVVGGSMSGLLAAALLRRIGWEVDVFERSNVELVGRGAGITVHPELLDVLELSGAGTRDLGVAVDRRIALDERGRVIAERPLRQILTSWDRLQSLLRDREPAGRYHLGHAFDAALARFEALRQPIGERVVEHAQMLGTHLAVDLRTEEDRATWKVLQDPEAMMRHITVPHFLTEPRPG